MNVLLIGGGRMGQRHLRGILGEASSVTLIDPLQQARELCRNIAQGTSFLALNDINELTKSSASSYAEWNLAELKNGHLSCPPPLSISQPSECVSQSVPL